MSASYPLIIQGNIPHRVRGPNLTKVGEEVQILFAALTDVECNS